ncbi:phospholipase A2 [Austrofundulus limnaeus]|uniref:Phospholipase A2 n=1 Tax=Austrofundulus limnaeus TaxID=52670 RepID=A0A2I4DDB3_AUSLI|nr:PREDICTED: phospholipase A2-like [Austrofundulus limnaeus]
MNGPALLLLLLTACVVRGGVFQYLNMIKCVQPAVNPVAYSDYGCYCGHKGTVTPVDEVDKCCQTHGRCYETFKMTQGCESIFINPFLLIYKYSCVDQQVTCSDSDSNDECQAALCECDRAAAHCFSNKTYNPQNEHLYSSSRCEKTALH